MIDRRCLLLVGAALPFAAGSAGAMAEQLRTQEFHSRSLGRSLPYLTYTTAGAGAGSPVVYLLHGHGGSEWAWIQAGEAVATVDAMVAGGILPPLHLVMPGVGNSWYVDAPEPHGPVATALLAEFQPAIEAKLAVDPGRRALIGLSMGGWGALHLGLSDPARWRFLGALSPAVFEPGIALPDYQIQLFAGAFGEPFDTNRFRAADPFELIPRLAGAEHRPVIYLSCGEEDYFGLHVGTAAFHRALEDAGVPAALRIKPGRHDWEFWRAELPEALAHFAAALDADDSSARGGAG